MKFVRLQLCAGVFAALLTTGSFAQVTQAQVNATDAPKEEKTFSAEHIGLGKELTVLSGLSEQYDAMIQSMAQSMAAEGRKNTEIIPHLNDILTMLKPELDILKQQMVNKSGRIFADKIQESDLKNIVAFFKSETGVLYVRKQSEVLAKLGPILRDWAGTTEEYLDLRMRAELQKRDVIIQIPRKNEQKPGDSAPNPAADTPQATEEQVKLARKVAIDSGLTRSYDGLMTQLVLGLRERMMKDPGFHTVSNSAEVLSDVITSLQPEVDRLRGQIVDETAKVLAQNIPEDKMKEIDTFFNSESGKVYVEQLPKIYDDLIPEMDAWLKKCIEYINTRTRGELAKRGYQFQ